MNKTLTAQIGELAESLHDLRRRFRHSARYEVACVIGEALRDAAMALIGGPAPRAKMPGRGYAAWNDPWGEPVADRWHGPDSFPDVMEADEEVPQSAMRLSPSLLVGMGAARWSFARTRQLGPAMLIGLLVALIATMGSPTIQALVDAWSVAIDLLSPSSSDREL
jgi:hypothetical protein